MPIVSSIVGIGTIFFASSFAMTVTGFGFALISVPLLSFFMPVREAVAFQFPHCFALFAYQAWHYRRHFHFSDLKPLLGAVAIGLVLGTLLLHRLPAEFLKKALSVFIFLVVLTQVSTVGRGTLASYAGKPWWGHLCGLLSGLFFGAYTTGGPPAALYILSLHKDPLRAKSFIATFFSIQFILVAIIYSASGLLTFSGLLSSLYFTPFVITGAILGYFVAARVSARTGWLAMQVMLIATAVALWSGS